MLRDSLNKSKNMLKDSGIESYAIDAELLMMKVTNLSRVEVLTDIKKFLTDAEEKLFWEFINMRLEFKPVQYILNKCEFMSLGFYVDENVLIPRADTEILVEESIKFVNNYGLKKVLDVGTGSGCIGISVAKYTEALVTAIDVSEAALLIAEKNGLLNNVFDKMDFILSDTFENVTERYDLIISNPPYISENEMKSLDRNVICYEPYLALFGGKDGLNFYRNISEKAKTYLNESGILIFEIGYNQKMDVFNILTDFGYKNIVVTKDLSGKDRVVSCNI